jgi:dephospho-CoA kinase
VRRPVRVVGLTGGIGAGKSEALAAFARHGVATLSSDQVVHDLYLTEGVRDAVVEHWGADVLKDDGTVDRSQIARRVFGDDAERRWLEDMILPLISERFFAWRDEQLAAGVPLLVHEAPTMFEAGVQDRYDAIITVTAPLHVRHARRPGSTERMAAQLPEAEKVARSDFVYTNDGDLEQLDRFVVSVLEQIGAR